jgi:hypothetical protein
VGKIDGSAMPRTGERNPNIFIQKRGNFVQRHVEKNYDHPSIRGGLGGIGEGRQRWSAPERVQLHDNFQRVTARPAMVMTKKVEPMFTPYNTVPHFRNVSHGMHQARPERIERVTRKMPFAHRTVATLPSYALYDVDRGSIRVSKKKSVALHQTPYRITEEIRNTENGSKYGLIDTKKKKMSMHREPTRFLGQTGSFDFAMRSESQRYNSSMRPAQSLIEPRLIVPHVGRKSADLESTRLLN